MNIYIGNLSYQTTENQLQGIFAEYGPVKSVKIILDPYTKRSRGFGFIEMETREAGQEAIEKINNTSINLQAVTVNEARPKTEGSSRSGGYNNRY
jgi:RNA recognition motif-containing protein